MGAAAPVAATCHNPFKVGTDVPRGLPPVFGRQRWYLPVRIGTRQLPSAPFFAAPGGRVGQAMGVTMAAGTTEGGHPRGAYLHSEPPSRRLLSTKVFLPTAIPVHGGTPSSFLVDTIRWCKARIDVGPRHGGRGSRREG